MKTRRELFERDLHVTQSRQPVVAINTELAHWLDNDKQKEKNPEIQHKLATERAWIKLGPKILRSQEKAGDIM